MNGTVIFKNEGNISSPQPYDISTDKKYVVEIKQENVTTRSSLNAFKITIVKLDLERSRVDIAHTSKDDSLDICNDRECKNMLFSGHEMKTNTRKHYVTANTTFFVAFSVVKRNNPTSTRGGFRVLFQGKIIFNV